MAVVVRKIRRSPRNYRQLPRKRGHMYLARHIDPLQEQWKTNRDRDHDGRVFAKLDRYQSNLFEILYVPDRVVWAQARPSIDIQPRVWIASTLVRGFERKRVLSEHITLTTVRADDLILPVLGPKLDRLIPLKDLSYIQGHKISACITHLDPVQQFRLHERSASTAEPQMVLRETGSEWYFTMRGR